MQQKILLNVSKMLLILKIFGLIWIRGESEAQKDTVCFWYCVRVQDFNVSQGQQDKSGRYAAFELSKWEAKK